MYHNASSFATAKIKPVVAHFNGGKLISNAGTLLLQLADRKLRLPRRINFCIRDLRDQRYITHQQRDLLAQRIYALCLGDEDVNDQAKLRKDPALLVTD